jgi:hypothetical protein
MLVDEFLNLAKIVENLLKNPIFIFSCVFFPEKIGRK